MSYPAKAAFGHPKNKLYFTCKNINYNQLYSGLYTYENLKNVPVLQNNLDRCTKPFAPTNINMCVPFFLNYTIDPHGQLFGNTSCGLNNYQLFRRPYCFQKSSCLEKR